MAGHGCWGRVLHSRHWEQSRAHEQKATGVLACWSRQYSLKAPLYMFPHLSSISAVMLEERFAACFGASVLLNVSTGYNSGSSEGLPQRQSSLQHAPAPCSLVLLWRPPAIAAAHLPLCR